MIYLNTSVSLINGHMIQQTIERVFFQLCASHKISNVPSQVATPCSNLEIMWFALGNHVVDNLQICRGVETMGIFLHYVSSIDAREHEGTIYMV